MKRWQRIQFRFKARPLALTASLFRMTLILKGNLLCHTNFEDVTFSGLAYFKNVTFCSHTNFGRAVFLIARYSVALPSLVTRILEGLPSPVVLRLEMPLSQVARNFGRPPFLERLPSQIPRSPITPFLKTQLSSVTPIFKRHLLRRVNFRNRHFHRQMPLFLKHRLLGQRPFRMAVFSGDTYFESSIFGNSPQTTVGAKLQEPG